MTFLVTGAEDPRRYVLLDEVGMIGTMTNTSQTLTRSGASTRTASYYRWQAKRLDEKAGASLDPATAEHLWRLAREYRDLAEWAAREGRP